MVTSHAMRNTPSTPVIPKPSTIFCVSRKGTRSGVSNVLPCASVSNGEDTYLLAQPYLLEETVEVDMDHITSVRVQ